MANHNSKQAHNTRQNQNTRSTYISPGDWDKLICQKKKDNMKKRGTWEDRGNQEGSSTSQQPPSRGRQGRVSSDKKTTRYVKNMEQSGYDYEEEESDNGGEEEAVPRNTSTPSINSIITSI